MDTKVDFSVPALGRCSIPSPIRLSTVAGDALANYVGDADYVRYEVDAKEGPRSPSSARGSSRRPAPGNSSTSRRATCTLAS
jgi:hypothetical protein